MAEKDRVNGRVAIRSQGINTNPDERLADIPVLRITTLSNSNSSQYFANFSLPNSYIWNPSNANSRLLAVPTFFLQAYDNLPQPRGLLFYISDLGSFPDLFLVGLTISSTWTPWAHLVLPPEIALRRYRSLRSLLIGYLQRYCATAVLGKTRSCFGVHYVFNLHGFRIRLSSSPIHKTVSSGGTGP